MQDTLYYHAEISVAHRSPKRQRGVNTPVACAPGSDEGCMFLCPAIRNRSILLSALLVVLLFPWTVYPCCGAETSGNVIDVDSKKQLFVDEMFIESSRGIRLTMNPPYQIGDLLIKADQPWETKGGGWIDGSNSVIKQDGRIRMWYDLIVGEGRCMCYAESEDGIHFTKLKLGIEFHGFKDTNVLIGRSRGGTVWIDPKAPPQQRYKSQCKGKRGVDGRLHFFGSPDGIRWQHMHGCWIGPCDTQNVAFWDRNVQRYVLYTRGREYFEYPKIYEKRMQIRMVRRLESDDLIHWDNESIVMKADKIDLATYETTTPEPPVDYYGGAIFRYPDADGVYILPAMAFWHWCQHSPVKAPGPQAIDARLMVSRDGKNFKRLGGRKPFLRLGPDGSFYSRMVRMIRNPIRMGDELWIYYSGRNRDHGGITDPASGGELRTGIGRAVMRLDGFVSADADYTGGEIVTPPIKFAGARLELNLDTSGGGSVRVELLDEKGRPIQGYTKSEATPLCGNSVQMPVSWGRIRDVSALAGKPIKIRFVMRDCKLYAFQFKE